MARRRKDRALYENRAFSAAATIAMISSLAFIWAQRLRGLGYFDGSEYALHIAGGGVAHAPGYPLFTILGKFIHALGPDAFVSQQVLSMLALAGGAIALRATFALEVGKARSGFAAASAITLASFAGSYLLRLFSILPEVFVFNAGLFAVLIYAITHFWYAPTPIKVGVIFFIYGLGVCHHHTLALTLPACFTLLGKKARHINLTKSAGFAALGFALGCLPLAYLFHAGANANLTYFRVHDLDSLLFVLLRKGYGTFKLSPLATQTDLAGNFRLTLEGLVKNFNGWGILIFVPLLREWPLPKKATRKNTTSSELTPRAHAYGWGSPSLIVAVSTLALFLILFVPNCNLELNVRTYRTIFLRFLTIPAFLLLYLVFKSTLHAWDWALKWGRSGQSAVATGLFLCIFTSALSNNAGLTYGKCNLLDEHVSKGYSAIFSQVRPAPVPNDARYHQCAIFAEGDTLLTGINYYNEFTASQKCYIYSTTSLSGQFLSGRELGLAARTLGINLRDLEAGAYARRPEALLNLFLKLDAQGYALFVFNVTDYTGYFGKMFKSSPFAYRPVGNILQIVTQTSKPVGMDQMYASYESYVRDLEGYLARVKVDGVPTQVADSQANQALILNLADYAKFAPVYPAPKQAVQQLVLRARAVERQWLELMPRETN